MLPGWYGAGQALRAFPDQGLLREMAAAGRSSARPLDNMEMVLAKSDMAIARRYATLVQDRILADTLFNRIHLGWGQHTTACSPSPASHALLESNPTLDASIRLRLPYVEPLNLLQIELLKRHRAGEDGTSACAKASSSRSNAVATALRNSG